MTNENPFQDLSVIGALPPEAVAAKLRELGEDDAAAAVESASVAPPAVFGRSSKSWWPFRDRAWQHTAHAFGFLPPLRGSRAIESVGNIEADESLKGARLKIALNRLRVADYPGRGMHRILFDFYARNQVPGQVEDLHFNATYRVREGERAPIAGYPIFIGLNVGKEGAAFRCHTVNVKNEADETLLGFLEGDVFRSGLRLATTAQPALAPLSGLALGLTKAIASRNRNISVQDFYLGLDFAGTQMGARLAIGDYIAVQIPEALQSVWRWNDWIYDAETGMIVSSTNAGQLLSYNYVVFGISRYEE